MKRRSFLRSAGWSLFATALPAPASEGKRPNVLFILADDLGIGGLHCYGNDWVETPHLDRLCSRGMKFVNGLAAYPTCKPSRAAILTGQYGPRTGVYRVCDSYGNEDKARLKIPRNGVLDPKKPSIGKVFKQAGYATAMYGKWHVSNERKTHPSEYFGFDEAFVSHGGHYRVESLPPVEKPDDVMMERIYTEKAKAFMERSVKGGTPFFLFMPYYLIHAPFEARPDYVERFRKKLKGVNLFRKGKKDPMETLPVVLAMTKMLDDFVGELLAKLDALGVAENTVVLFTSDNGSYDRNLVGGYRGRKGDTYDGGMRVPYFFRWPGKIAAGSVCQERIIGVDVYPTLLGLSGVPKPPPSLHPLDGEDLTPLLLGKREKLPPRAVYCFYPKYAQFREKSGKWQFSWRNVVYDGDWKLIEYPEYGEYELFDLTNDPKETENLAAKRPERRETMTHKLHDWLKRIGAPPPESNPGCTLQDRVRRETGE